MIFKLVYIYFFLYLLCNMYDIYLFGRKYDFFSCKFVFIFILNEFGLLIIIYLRFIIVRYVYFNSRFWFFEYILMIILFSYDS